MEEFDFGGGGGLPPSPQTVMDEGPPKVTADGLQPIQIEDKAITDLLLGVVNWWCLKFGKHETVNLVKRHFEHEEVYRSSLDLAGACGLGRPVKHKGSFARPAIDANADDLVTNMKQLIDSKKLPKIVIPAGELGRVPLDAISVSNERSVSARLESLEECVKKVVNVVEKLAVRSPTVPSLAPLPGLSITPPC